MSNELNIPLETGLTLTGKVYSFDGTQQGSDVAMTEASTGQYTGDYSLSGVPDGAYMVMFFVGTVNRGFGGLYVLNESEVDSVRIAERTDRLPDIPASRQDIIVGANS